MDTLEDTDTLLALVSSLLKTKTQPDPAEILDALVKSNGDPTAAAQLLEHPKPVLTKKRKRIGDLDDWLKSPASTSITSQITPKSDSKGKGKAVILDSPSPSKRAQASPSTSKPIVDLMSVLRQPPPSTKQPIPRLPPLTLSSPSLVSQHTPCTLHLSILPPELACKLFYTMLDASEGWKKNKWWLFDKVVESPHRTSFYTRKVDGEEDDWEDAAQYWYNGRKTDPPPQFPDAMEEACSYVEAIVNSELAKRPRYPLEWAGGKGWRANVAAANCYEGGKESVGFHSDQLTYLGPYPTIASLSLGTSRVFRLREVIPTEEKTTRQARTYNIPLAHNSLTIMHASTQERYKHSIPPQSTIDLYRPAYPHPHSPQPSSLPTIEPSNVRMNITFRFYRPDFRGDTIPRCHCGVPTILRPDMKKVNMGKEKEKEGMRYWWTCYAGAQNGGKGCSFWRVLDMEEEGRGPCVGVGGGGGE